MATIEGLGGAGPVRATPRGRPTADGAGFQVPAGSAEQAGGSETTGGASAVVLDAMLALQEMDPALEQDRHARRHGQSVLAALTALQAALVAGGDASESALHRLEGLLAGMPQAADPALAGVLAAVSLRARVELARRGR